MGPCVKSPEPRASLRPGSNVIFLLVSLQQDPGPGEIGQICHKDEFSHLASPFLPGKLGFVPAFLVSACRDSLRNLPGFIDCISKEEINTRAFLLTT